MWIGTVKCNYYFQVDGKCCWCGWKVLLLCVVGMESVIVEYKSVGVCGLTL